MKKPQKQTSVITLELFSLLMVCSLFAGLKYTQSASTSASVSKSSSASEGKRDKKKDKDFIKWVDFTVPYEALCVAYNLDVESHDTDIPLNWIELLAYTATKSTVINRDATENNTLSNPRRYPLIVCPASMTRTTTKSQFIV